MNEIELQRLVDGECNDRQQAEILGSLGEDVDQWRQLALHLLEEQRLQKYFAIETGSTAHGLPVDRMRIDQEEHVSCGKHNSSRPPRWHSTLAVLAASFLCMMLGSAAYYGAAYYNGLLPERIVATNDPLTNHTTSPRPETTRPVKQQELQPVGRLQLPPLDDSGDVWETLVYEVSPSEAERLVAENANRLTLVNSQLNRRGWNANVDTSIYKGQMEDGRSMFLPVNVVRLEPLGY
jgi:hypothetical protein